MIPLETIPCRWREPTSQENLFKCNSVKIQASYGVTSEMCSGCYLRNHEPVEPGLLEKAKNFSKSVLDIAKSGMEQVSPEEKERRIKTCEGCMWFTKKRTCSKCGCYTEAKSGWKSQDCPVCKECNQTIAEGCQCKEFKSKWEN